MEPLVVLLGPTGAGKSQQAKALARHFNLVRISSGDLLRATGDSRVLAAIEEGRVVDPGIVQRVVGEALSEVEEGRGVIIDGFPRTKSDVEWLDKNIGNLNFEILKVVFIDVPKEISLTRLSHRGRSDDAKKVVENRWDQFANHTLPVIAIYEDRDQLARVDGRKLPDVVTADIAKVLEG